MSIIIDAVIVAVLVVFLLIGRKKGFVYTAIELIGWIAIAVIAIPFAQTSAAWIYDTFIDNSVCAAVNASLQDISPENISNALNGYIDNLPDFISSSLFEKDITATFILSQAEAQSNIASAVSNVIKPVICPLISAIISIIIFIIGFILIRLLARLCNGLVDKIPLVSNVNAFLGAITGFVKGAVIVAILSFVFITVINTSQNGLFGITAATVDNTYILKAIVEFLI